jgi:hypothetical protein
MDFKYNTFRGILDDNGSAAAMKYYSSCFNSENLHQTLRARVDVVSKLETDFGIVGTHINVSPGEDVLLDESVDYVVSSICNAAELIRRMPKVPGSGAIVRSDDSVAA